MKQTQSLSSNLQVSMIFRFTRELARRSTGWVLRHWCGLEIEGQAQLQGLTQCLLAPNHASHLDFWAVLEGLPPTLRKQTYIAAAEDYFYRKFYRQCLMKLIAYHNFSFDRQATPIAGYRQIVPILQKGFSLLMFPQGTRSRDGSLLPFKPLMAILSLQTGIPVVPVAVRGTFEALGPGKGLPSRHRIQLGFGAPVFPGRYLTPKSASLHQAVKMLNQDVMSQIQELWQKWEIRNK